MVEIKVFFLIFAGLSLTTETLALTNAQVNRLVELNSMFDLLHKNYDNQIHLAYTQQKTNMKIFNAQFLSRYGFVLDQMHNRTQEINDAIEERGNAIGNHESECLGLIRWSLDQALDYAGRNFVGIFEEVMEHINRIQSNTFYPLTEVLHYQSNGMQWEVISVLRFFNPVINMNSLIQRLEEDYSIILLLYDNAIVNMRNEINLVTRQINQAKAVTFPVFNNVFAYFSYTVNALINNVGDCNE